MKPNPKVTIVGLDYGDWWAVFDLEENKLLWDHKLHREWHPVGIETEDTLCQQCKIPVPEDILAHARLAFETNSVRTQVKRKMRNWKRSWRK